MRTKEGDAALAFDGRSDTSYVVSRPLRGDEFVEARFDRPRTVSGVEIVLRHESAWPTRFRVAVLNLDGRWTEAARWDGPHTVQLVDSLLGDPTAGTIGFALSGDEVAGVAILPEIGGPSALGWNLPEVRILSKR